VASEGVNNRVLYATSADAITWTKPNVMFKTTGPVGLENEPHVIISSRRYAIGGSWDVFARTGGGAEHTGPDTPLMRRVHGPESLGPVFWLGKEVPQGYERFGYPTYFDRSIDAQTRADAAAYVAALVDTEPTSDWGLATSASFWDRFSRFWGVALQIAPHPKGAVQTNKQKQKTAV